MIAKRSDSYPRPRGEHCLSECVIQCVWGSKLADGWKLVRGVQDLARRQGRGERIAHVTIVLSLDEVQAARTGSVASDGAKAGVDGRQHAILIGSVARVRIVPAALVLVEVPRHGAAVLLTPVPIIFVDAIGYGAGFWNQYG